MNRNLKNILSLPLVLACAFFISSCSKDEVEIERPEKVYYDTAQRRMKVNNYFGAIESLQRIETQYPFGKYAEQVQVELVYCYFMMEKLRLRIQLQKDSLDFIQDILILTMLIL